MKNINWSDKLLDVGIVITGILIALALNGWFDAKQEAKLEQQYLTTILEDIIADIEDLQDDRGFAKEQAESVSKALDLILGRDTSTVDSLMPYTVHLGNFKEFRSQSTTYRSLVQSGEIHVIKDYTLKKELGSLHLSSYDLVSNAEHIYFDFYLELLDLLRKNYNYISGEISNAEAFYNTEFINQMAAMASATQQKILHYEGAIEDAEEVKRHLERNID